MSLSATRDSHAGATRVDGLGNRLLARTVRGMAAVRDPRLSVLIFHRVHRVRDPLFPGEPCAESFEELMRLVGRCFRVLPLFDALDMLARGTLPPAAVAITFDDGYADNATVALPVLARLSLHATFFIAAGFLDGGRMFNDTVIESVRAFEGAQCDLGALGSHATATPADKAAAIDSIIRQVKHLPPAARDEAVAGVAQRIGAPLPTNLMLTSVQLRELAAAGMGIGGHTLTHPILTRIPFAQAEREIAEGRDRLEALCRVPIRLFAYPNGVPRSDYDAGHVSLVRRLGFAAACSTAAGVARRDADLYQVPRFTPWDQAGWKFCLRLAHNLSRVDYATA